MTREEKRHIVEELSVKLKENQAFYIADDSGLTVAQVNAFRQMCFDKGVEYKVYKNTLVRKALESIDAADASIMDYNEDFDARMEDLGSQDLGASEMGDMEFDGEETTKGWFDGVFEDGDFDMDFGDW